MNPAKKAIARAQEFVSDHKTAITIVATATATAAVCAKLTKSLRDGYVETVTEFLAEKNLTDEFNALFEDVTN
jgi:hypothetical protein